MDSNFCMSESEKYKAKIKKLIQDKGLCSVMNNTKWKELKKGAGRNIYYLWLSIELITISGCLRNRWKE